jgi:hypothetical protein
MGSAISSERFARRPRISEKGSKRPRIIDVDISGLSRRLAATAAAVSPCFVTLITPPEYARNVPRVHTLATGESAAPIRLFDPLKGAIDWQAFAACSGTLLGP